MLQADINWLAVAVATVVAMVVGALWYMPALFGKAWMNELGKQPENLGNATSGYLVAVVGNLVMIYVLAHFVDYTVALTALEGATVGFWAWLGFVATSSAINGVFEGKSFKLWAINAGMMLVVLVLAGAILAVWR